MGAQKAGGLRFFYNPSMNIAIYSTKDYEVRYLEAACAGRHSLRFIPASLTGQTATLAKGCEAVCIFAGDDASAPVLEALHGEGVNAVSIRAAGYDNVDLDTAHRLGIKVANVPAYSPYAIAEHAIALILALNRKLVLADRQVHAHNFTVGGLVGFDLHSKTVGLIGTGNIGSKCAHILHGFGCELLAYDLRPDAALAKACNIRYVSLEELYASAHIISLHTPLNKTTTHLIDQHAIAQMQRGVMLINTARGRVVKTNDVLAALRSGHIGAFGADVYEGEHGLFFYDRSADVLTDQVLLQLLQMPNVLITPHQAYATVEALTNIADTTFINVDCWDNEKESPNEL